MAHIPLGQKTEGIGVIMEKRVSKDFYSRKFNLSKSAPKVEYKQSKSEPFWETDKSGCFDMIPKAWDSLSSK